MNINYLHKNAILVYVVCSQKKEKSHRNLEECSSLAYSAGIRVVDVLIGRCVVVNAKYFIGLGKLVVLHQMIKEHVVSVVLFSCTLSPNQERNLTSFLDCKIIDRNQLILEIFAQRARTYEGKLQVKLAQLRYLNSRLTHGWSHLERQKGGISTRGGPGEMQLESDRRVLRKKITQVLLQIKKIENQREQSRHRRVKSGLPTISLVGYTNAGKSTLFNVMTESNMYTEKKLFSTLDPTFRRVVSRKDTNWVLVDTVGFIRDLPKDLMSSFKATLQETIRSTLLLHVVDVSDEDVEEHINIVDRILHEMHIFNIPILLVMNKIDQLKEITSPSIDRDNEGKPLRVWISAQYQLGMSLLIQALDELLVQDVICYDLRIPINNDVCQKLYRMQIVKQFWMEDDNNIRLTIQLSSVDWNRLLKQNKLLLDYII